MRQFLLILLLTAVSALAQDPARKVAAVLNDWHQAAAAADEPRYFGHFTADGVFMGTDATERWTVRQFRAWARPHFDGKSTWSFTPRDRHIAFSPDGQVAWFDEMLDTPKMGPCRGSGVLLLSNGIWKIAQYNLSVPVPNALLADVVAKIAAAGK